MGSFIHFCATRKGATVLDLSIFFRPWWMIFSPPSDYPRIEGEALQKQAEIWRLIREDNTKRLLATTAPLYD